MRETYAEFREPVDDVTWTMSDSRMVGSELVAVATEIAVRGTASGINALAHGGWLVRFEGDLIAEGELHQSFEDALLAGRRRLLAAARLYFVCEALPDGRDPGPLLEAAIARRRRRDPAAREGAPLRRGADRLRRAVRARRPRARGALLPQRRARAWSRPADADGVHVGQDDEPVAAARAAAGAAALVGLSTHSPAQFDAALAAPGGARPDQISAGPGLGDADQGGAAGRRAGADRARGAGRRRARRGSRSAASTPRNVGEVVAAGARRIVVVRAIRDAADPEAAARELRAALAAEPEG